MAASGAKVLQLRSVEYARNHGVRIHCRSSFTDGPAPSSSARTRPWNARSITAVTHSTDEARVTLIGVPDRPGVAGAHLHARSPTANVNVDMIVQNEPVSERRRPRSRSPSRSDDLPRRARTLERVRRRVGSTRVDDDPRWARSRSSARACAVPPRRRRQVFETLGEQGINIEMISTSPIKISCVIAADRVTRRGPRPAPAFDLGAEDVRTEDPFGVRS